MSNSQPPPPPEENAITEALAQDWAAIRNRGDFRPMDDADLVKFVLGVCDDKIFTLHHIRESQREQMAPMVFMPLALGAFTGWHPAELEDIGSIWAYYSEAGPRSINGLPMFMTFRVIVKSDWKKACIAIDRENARRKASVGTILDDLNEAPSDPAPV